LFGQFFSIKTRYLRLDLARICDHGQKGEGCFFHLGAQGIKFVWMAYGDKNGIAHSQPRHHLML
jgi:hypothetical protein